MMESLACLFKALGDVTRLKLVRLLAEDEYCVCELVELLGCSQSGVSQHLAKLKAAGIVHERRQGQWTYYRLQSGVSERVQSALSAFVNRPLTEIAELADETARLATLDRANCCR